MPYINQDRRPAIAVFECPENAGELNYLITIFIKEYFESHSNYQGINDIMGALEGAKAEFYRRVAVPYEDKKILENGDVY
jgi:hypothetical protein